MTLNLQLVHNCWQQEKSEKKSLLKKEILDLRVSKGILSNQANQYAYDHANALLALEVLGQLEPGMDVKQFVQDGCQDKHADHYQQSARQLIFFLFASHLFEFIFVEKTIFTELLYIYLD